MRDNIPEEYRISVKDEFRNSKMEEQIGMNAVNASYKNDFLTLGDRKRIDPYELGELEPSWCTQLDTVGMQPHAREYVEREMNNSRSEGKFQRFENEYVNHPQGIHFDGRP